MENVTVTFEVEDRQICFSSCKVTIDGLQMGFTNSMTLTNHYARQLQSDSWKEFHEQIVEETEYSYGEILNNLREERGLTMDEMAKEITKISRMTFTWKMIHRLEQYIDILKQDIYDAIIKTYPELTKPLLPFVL